MLLLLVLYAAAAGSNAAGAGAGAGAATATATAAYLNRPLICFHNDIQWGFADTMKKVGLFRSVAPVSIDQNEKLT